MKIKLYSLLLILTLSTTFSQKPNFDLVGFASLNGGTSGGAGGKVVEVHNYIDLKKMAEEPETKYVIKVKGVLRGTGTFKDTTYNGSIKVASNKSIIGDKKGAYLDGIGLMISGNSKNIVIKNLKFSFVSLGKEVANCTGDIKGLFSKLGDEGRSQILVNTGDLVTISGSASNIWIDHCEFFNENPALQPNQDLYDGLLDIKNKTQYITISWCYFHDHHKSNLVGSSDKDIFDNRKVTFHHNRYENLQERLPLFRGGVAHVFNNYYNNCFHSVVNSRVNACVKVENNYFENCHNTVVSKMSVVLGKVEMSGNIEQDCKNEYPYPEACVADLGGYDYKKTLTPSTKVKKLVLKFAGVGVIKK